MPEPGKSEESRYYCQVCDSIYRGGFDHCPNDESPLQLLVEDPLVGKTLGGHYIIDKCVGEGAMGRVYLAHHARLTRRRFAIKVLLGDVAADPTMRMRFGQEAEVASRLQHPNVVSVLDYGKTDSDLLYLVMEFVEGDTLGDRIESGAIPESEVITLCKQLCLGLTHAHDEGLVHRDFKPENVVLVSVDNGVTPKILDFGLAIISSAEESSIRLTSAGMVVGTPAYVSPEQARALKVDHRTDLFALGVAMYEMLAGTLPFDGDVIEVLYANATKDAPPIFERNPSVEVSPGMEAIVRKLMAKEESARFQSATEVGAALEELSRGIVPEIVAAEVDETSVKNARKKLETAHTQIPTEAYALSVSDIPGLVDPQPEEAPSRSPFLWVVGLVCVGAVGAFAYTQMGKDSEDASAPVTRVRRTKPKPVESEKTPIVTPDRNTIEPETNEPVTIEPVTIEPETIEPETIETSDKLAVVESASNADAGVETVGSEKPKRIRKNRNVKDDKQANTAIAATTPVVVPTPIEPKVVPVPVVTVKPKVPVVVPPKPKTFDATTSVQGFKAKGPLSSKKMSRLVREKVGNFQQCYKTASKSANSTPSLSVKVSFSINESRRAGRIKVSGAKLPGMNACIVSAIKKIRSVKTPDLGDENISLTLKYTPK